MSRKTIAAAAGLLGFALVLVSGIALDPARGVTGSTSPFTDEGFRAVNARNLVLFGAWGSWSSDQWNLQDVQLPYSLLQAVDFRIFGVGFAQLRALSVALTVATAAVLLLGLRRRLERIGSGSAALAFATCPLMLYYGRLGYPEDLVVLALAAGTVLLLGDRAPSWVVGVLAGLAFAVAIGSKQNAVLAVGAITLGPLAVNGVSDRSIAKCLVAALATLALAAGVWVVAIWLPDSTAVRVDVTDILPAFDIPTRPAQVLGRVASFLRTDDGLGALLGMQVLGATAGLGLVVARWRTVSVARRRLAVACTLWAASTLGVMLLVSYHPNRYAIPAVPAIAILIGIGVAEAEAWWSEHAVRPRSMGAALALVLAILVAPGVIQQSRWTVGGGQSLASTEASYLAVIPQGAVVAGKLAPTFLLGATVTAIVIDTGTTPVNAGDLYASAGARWWILPPTEVPEVAVAHPTAWAARQLVRCDRWGGSTVCLYRLP